MRGLALALLASVGVVGCGDDGGGTGGSGATTGSAGSGDGVVYEGGATDEAYRELVALTPVDDPTERVNLTAPADGATLSGPTAITWALPRHGDPVNGLAYRLTFTGSDGALALDVFTLLGSYTPSDEAWAKVAAAADPVTVQIVSAVFESNRVTQDGGPFLGSSIAVTAE